ncbi:hypothetical protein [Bradyrhizobium sp. CCBAU 53421]|uniref:hypothetical protein n=1 Tax=Bradyrhizobium sp. CCBAU 53421 TaxID=1325120 RepID=UPI00188AAA22|nr:hypothetical protein [Bradyrhizobium sp. CCBAU 53421]QOZ31685.1 hypothetical protein XH92_08160 [Bradyrhizobium sp. CCBAU 53421]
MFADRGDFIGSKFTRVAKDDVRLLRLCRPIFARGEGLHCQRYGRFMMPVWSAMEPGTAHVSRVTRSSPHAAQLGERQAPGEELVDAEKVMLLLSQRFWSEIALPPSERVALLVENDDLWLAMALGLSC